LAAGARAAISTLWQIQDESAHILMTSFYRHWLISKDSEAAALADAKREAIQQDLVGSPA
jgi:CHAT domain-containing protein